MRIQFLIVTAFVCLLMEANLNGQKACKVLMPGISLHYKGTCKNGLAHGEGEAYGVDYYQGYFKKGLPDGEGIYKWSTGEVYKGNWRKGMRQGMGTFSFKTHGMDTTIVGKWVKDKFFGAGQSKSLYLITYKNNIGRVTITRISDGKEIRLKFLRHGGEVPVSGLLLYGDSGTVMNEYTFQGFDNVDYPFIGKITFSVMNDFGAASLYCELRFKILKPGDYQIYIFP